MDLKNKFLIVVTILLTLSIFCVSSVFAFNSTQYVEHYDSLVNYVKNLEEYNSYNNYLLCTWGYDNNHWHYNVIFFNGSNDLRFYMGYLNNAPAIYSNISFEYVGYSLEPNGDSYSIMSKYTQSKQLIYNVLNYDGVFRFSTNYPIYTDSSCNDFFFRPAIVLLEPVEVAQIPDKIRQITIILVPVGLIIFGLLLAPYLLKYRN